MNGKTSDDVVQHNERQRRRRPRATTYQLEIYKTSVDDALENDKSTAHKSPPRPLLRRNPHSSPVLSRTRYYSANAGLADSFLTTSPTSPTEYRLPPLFFEEHDYSDIFDERPRIEYPHTTPRLRRKAKMSITRESHDAVSGIQVLPNVSPDHSTLHGFPDIAPDDDSLEIPVKHDTKSLTNIRTRNDSKYSVFMQADAEKPRQKPLQRVTSKDITLDTQRHDGDCREGQRTYSTLTSLIQRLLATPSSDADVQFTSIFLTLYKMFAAPIELLDAMLNLMQCDSNHNRMTDTNSSARLIAIIHYWIVSYPGDFAQGPTRDKLKIFLSSFTKDDPFQARRQQIDQALDVVIQDDNTLWACKDDAVSLTPTMSKTSDVCVDQSPASITQVESRASETSKRASVTKSRSRISIPSLQRPSLSPTSNKSFTQQPMGKADWRAFMDLPEDILAQSIAIINRRLFLAAKPRDFVRQITVASKNRSSFSSLSRIAALTAHFNHLAHWVATMVLVRDKAKHRVLALEKVMRLARRVRSLNDYNALGAIVAGIHNSAIHRLQSTRELLDKDVAKDFARLEILMGSGKGHAAYRLAWENTTMKGRIPYLPVLLSDLVAADASGPIFAPQADTEAAMSPTSPASPASPASISIASRKDCLINWQKFARMGEVLLLLETAQASIQKHMAADAALNETARILLDRTVSNDDELYARSCAVETPASGYLNNTSSSSEAGIGKRFVNAFANMSNNSDQGELGSISQMRLPRQ